MKRNVLLFVSLFTISSWAENALLENYEYFKKRVDRVAFVERTIDDLPTLEYFEMSDTTQLFDVENLLAAIEKKDKELVDIHKLGYVDTLRIYFENRRDVDVYLEKLKALPVLFGEEHVEYMRELLSAYEALTDEQRAMMSPHECGFVASAAEYVRVIEDNGDLFSKVRSFELNNVDSLVAYERLKQKYDLRVHRYFPFDVRRAMVMIDNDYDEVSETLNGFAELPTLEKMLPKDTSLIDNTLELYGALREKNRAMVDGEIEHDIAKCAKMSVLLKKLRCVRSLSETDGIDSIYSLDSVLRNFPLSVGFAYDRVIYGPTGRELNIIRKYIKALNANPEAKLILKAFSVSVGRKKETKYQAYERAHSVRALLVMYGAREEQVELDYEMVKIPKEFKSNYEVVKCFRRVYFW